MKSHSINHRNGHQIWQPLSVTGFDGPYRVDSILPYSILPKQELVTILNCMYVRYSRLCSSFNKLLQRKPCKAEPNSKDKSGMGSVNYYKLATITRITMLLTLCSEICPISIKVRYLNLLNCGLGDSLP